jgi:hypothetical protein
MPLAPAGELPQVQLVRLDGSGRCRRRGIRLVRAVPYW